MGKRMFKAGEQMWPEEAPFHTSVFVLFSFGILPFEGVDAGSPVRAEQTQPVTRLTYAVRER
jgi:hypothetical protein